MGTRTIVVTEEEAKLIALHRQRQERVFAFEAVHAMRTAANFLQWQLHNDVFDADYSTFVGPFHYTATQKDIPDSQTVYNQVVNVINAAISQVRGNDGK